MSSLTKIGELWVCPESTYGTDPDTDGSDYRKVPAEEVAVSFSQEAIEREVRRDGLLKSYSSLPGQKGGTIAFKVPIHGLATVGSSGQAAALDPWLEYLLEGCGLVVVNGTGTTVSGSGSSTTVVDVTSAAGITAGTLVLINGEVRLVTAVNTAATPDNITVTPALTSAPANTNVVYASSSLTIDNSGTFDVTPVAFVWKAHGTEVTILGCGGTVKIEPYDAGARPMLSFEFQIGSFATSSNKSSVPSALTMRTPLLARRSAGDTTGAGLWWGSTATATASSSIGFDPGFTLSPKPSVNGIEGRVGWVVTDEAAVITARPYQAQSTYWTDYQTPTLRTVLVQLGNTNGAAFGIAAEQAQIQTLPTEEDVGGIRANGLTLRVREPTTSGIAGCVFGFF